jgi:8-oxo-dGTP pyrophosphatase MutT (NUDIX family)
VTEFDWREEPVPAGLPVLQVHGWLADETGRFLLRDDADGARFQLAGGKRENADRGWAHTLLRESAEECQVTLATDSIAYLGHQVVTEDPAQPGAYAQVRLFGVITEFGPSAPDPDSGLVYRRLMTAASRAATLLDWGLPGELQSRAAVRAARRTGLPAGDRVPDSYA